MASKEETELTDLYWLANRLINAMSSYDNLKTGYLYHINAMNNIIAIAKTDISKRIFIDQKAYWQEKLRQLNEMAIVRDSKG